MTERSAQSTAASGVSLSTFGSIQTLRGVAALLVVIFHAGLRFDSSEMTFRTGNAGVDIFFVISGFVMWTVTARRPTRPLVFLQQRFVRLAPMYWCFTLLMFATSTLAPSMVPRMRPTVPHLLLSMAFVPHVSPNLDRILPLLGQGWTLNFEVFFYLIFAVALALRTEWRLPAIGASLLALPVLGVFVLTPEIPITTLLSPLLIEFLGGIGIAWFVTTGRRLPVGWSWTCVILGVALLACAEPAADAEWGRLLEFGIPAFFVVGGMVGAETSGALRFTRLPLWLGDASYSIYLSHTFVISALGKVWPNSLAPWPFIVTATVCSALMGGLIYVVIERPLLALMRGRHRLPFFIQREKAA